jgi:hypothetical protein
VYIDPNAPPPDLDTQSTRPSSSSGPGAIGSSLGDLVEAASSGALRVDYATGDATIRALDEIRDELDTYRRLVTQHRIGPGSRLGGGYGEQIDEFNREWTVGDKGSVAEVLDTFRTELARMREAVQRSMVTYEASDQHGVEHLRRAEGDR